MCLSNLKKVKCFRYLGVITIMFLGMSTSAVSYAQTSIDSEKTHSELIEELAGTYQIQMINVRYQPAIDTGLLRKIKSERKLDTQLLIDISNNIKVTVLSQEEVDAGVRFSEIVSYINE